MKISHSDYPKNHYLDGEITNEAKGGNAIYATNNGVVTTRGIAFTSTAANSRRELHATYGGSIIASKVIIPSTGDSCGTLSTDRGERYYDCSLTKEDQEVHFFILLVLYQ